MKTLNALLATLLTLCLSLPAAAEDKLSGSAWVAESVSGVEPADGTSLKLEFAETLKLTYTVADEPQSWQYAYSVADGQLTLEPINAFGEPKTVTYDIRFEEGKLLLLTPKPEPVEEATDDAEGEAEEGEGEGVAEEDAAEATEGAEQTPAEETEEEEAAAEEEEKEEDTREPVWVLVANYAASLNALIGETYELVPVYWGDLGADDTYLHKVIGRHPSSSSGFSHMVHEAVARPLNRGGSKARAWLERRRGDRQRSAAIERQSKQRSADAKLRVRGYLGDKFQDVRLWLTQQTLPFIADVIVYQSHTYREKIQARVREVIRREFGTEAGTVSQPVKIIAHSLGGVVTFDMACLNHEPLYIEAFITMGSQPAFFHLLDPREGVAKFEGEPVTVPPTIGRWTNVWDEYDMLGFATDEVFHLHDGTTPLDVRVRATKSRLKGGLMMRSHLRYFTNQDTADAIRVTLDGVAYDFVDITLTPPKQAELKKALAAGYGIKDLFNKSGGQYRELNMKHKLPLMSDAEAVKLLAGNGYLVKRPICLEGERVTVGFKEDVIEEAWG
eukprot:g12381.t1